MNDDDYQKLLLAARGLAEMVNGRRYGVVYEAEVSLVDEEMIAAIREVAPLLSPEGDGNAPGEDNNA